MLKLTTLPSSPGTTRGRVSGYCRPGRIAADASAHAADALKLAQKKRSRAADGILLALVVVLLLAGLTQCTPARKAAAQRHRDEHPAPAFSRNGWNWDDTRDN